MGLIDADGVERFIRCKVCSDPVARKEYGDFGWVHVNETVSILPRMASTHDHEAEPDVIDVEVRPWTDPPPPPPPSAPRARPWRAVAGPPPPSGPTPRT